MHRMDKKVIGSHFHETLARFYDDKTIIADFKIKHMTVIAKVCATFAALRNGVAGLGHATDYFRDLARQNRIARKSDTGLFC